MKDLDSLKELIKENVSLGEILRIEGHITNTISEEQFSCPFHGIDRKKSSRYYRETDSAYCWVCKEKWDVISYIRKKEGLSFGGSLNYLIQQYSIDISVLPEATEEHVKQIQQVSAPKVDKKKLALEKFSQAITVTRDDVDYPTYLKMVYAFMVLKYAVPEEKFLEESSNLKKGMLRVFERLQKDG